MDQYIDANQLLAQSNARRGSKPEQEKSLFDIDAPGIAEDIALSLQEKPAAFQPLGLSDEILLRVMKKAAARHAPLADVLGQTCRQMYLISRHEILWHYLADLASARPKGSAALIKGQYETYRKMFLLRPRLRTDGIYISKITYFRPGLSETSMIHPVHLVTYYRYLRFFGASDGYRVWWLVASKPPKDVIDILRNPRKRRELVELDEVPGPVANIFWGQYQRLADKELVFEAKLDDARNPQGIKWNMQVELIPNPKPRAAVKHAMFKCIHYAPIDSESIPVNLESWSRFHFSKVRSYLT